MNFCSKPELNDLEEVLDEQLTKTLNNYLIPGFCRKQKSYNVCKCEATTTTTLAPTTTTTLAPTTTTTLAPTTTTTLAPPKARVPHSYY